MTIYLDNMAATPIDPRVAERHGVAMRQYRSNAHSSEHSEGAGAQLAIERAAEALIRAIDSSAETVTFTPGASPALWLAIEDAIGRAAGRPATIAATLVEHPSLLSALRRAERSGRIRLKLIPVNDMAAPCLDALEQAVADGVDLLCAMAANNEVGTVTDLSSVARIAKGGGARLLVDASQAAGRVDLVDADLVVVSGAKIYGPRRAGALIGRIAGPAADLAHDVFGSPDAPSAIALSFAMELRTAERSDDECRIATMRDALQRQLAGSVAGLRVNGDINSRLAGSLHISTPHLAGDAAVARLWGRVAVSTGAACQSGVPGPSHVLSAMGIPEWAKEGAVRIGLGRFNTETEIEEAGELIAAALNAAEPGRRRA